MNGKKIKILAVSDWADTGFGRVMKELMPRLVATGLFEVEMIGWAYSGDPDIYDPALAAGVRLHPVWKDDWGKIAAQSVGQRFKPQIIFTLGDPWMVEWVPELTFLT